jgi:hypothetical protein
MPIPRTVLLERILSILWGTHRCPRRVLLSGGFDSGTIEYGNDPRETRIQDSLCWRGPAAILKCRPAVSSERVLDIMTRNWVHKMWSWAPDGCLIPRHTGRLTVDRDITLTLTLTTDDFRLKLSRELIAVELKAGTFCRELNEPRIAAAEGWG